MEEGCRLMDGCGLKLGVLDGRRLEVGAALVVGLLVGMEDGDWVVVLVELPGTSDDELEGLGGGVGESAKTK
jgi:hypothetical protein